MSSRAGSAWICRACRLLALGCLMLAGSPSVAVAQAVQDQGPQPSGVLAVEDLRRAIYEAERLSAFYGEIAARDSNNFASARWAELRTNYLGIARQLAELLDDGRLSIVDLPGGVLRVASDGKVEIDERLDGQWLPSLVRVARNSGQNETGQSDLLLPVLIQALSQAKQSEGWPWFDDHVRRSGSLAPLVEEEARRPELARYFFLKDSYLSLSMRRIAEGDPARRHDWARRQMRAFTEVRGLRQSFAARYGAGPADVLRSDWSAYVALVDGFAVTRGWLMLDPALRMAQRREPVVPGTVDRAADEIVAGQETSILTLRAGQRAPGLTGSAPAVSDSQGSGPSLASLVNRVRTVEAEQSLQTEVSAQLPLQALLLRPELRTAPSETAEFRAFAARLKEAIRQPDPTLEIAKRDEALNAAALELTALQERVNELEPVEQEVAALQERVQVLNEAEQQVEALKSQVGELNEAQEQVAALQAQVDALGTALSAREGEAETLQEQLAEVRGNPASSIAPAVSRIEERQLYMMAAIAVMFLLTLVLWVRRRDRQVVVYEAPAAPAQVAGPPLLLNPPMPAPGPLPEQQPLPEVIEVAPEDTQEAGRAAGARKEALNGSVGNRYSQSDLQRDAAAVQAAALGDELSAAGHPIVRALRKGNLPLFELLFSELTDLRSPQLQRIVYGGGGEDLALACRAVEVDKLLFGSIFLLTDHLRGGDADGDPERIAAILSMYDRTAPDTARRVLLKWQRNWGVERPVGPSLVD